MTNDNGVSVAGDVCLDVVGVPVAPPAVGRLEIDNWRQTGETRTYFLAGGALLLEQFIRAACAVFKVGGRTGVSGPRPRLPTELVGGAGQTTINDIADFMKHAERLKRDEIVHSLLELDFYLLNSDEKKEKAAKQKRQLRVLATHGFSGPMEGDPSLEIEPPVAGSKILVIDDTGNRFRRSNKQWPKCLTSDDDTADSSCANQTLIYKLHRPLPQPEKAASDSGVAKSANGVASKVVADEQKSQKPDLWQTVKRKFLGRRIVIVSVDDLRDRDVTISRGLSWERTALDVVWQLQNAPQFAELRECEHLIVRFGLNGALHWTSTPDSGPDAPPYRAWLVYDPNGIEGTGEHAVEGRMVGYGSAFTAALTAWIVQSNEALPKAIEFGIKAGLLASRKLLELGFGRQNAGETVPAYPNEDLFAPRTDVEKNTTFACQPVLLIPQAEQPDRSYWRLIDSIFSGKRYLLNIAVALTATGAKPATDLEEEAKTLLDQVPFAVYAKALRTCDRREIENYRALYSLMLDYISQTKVPRPLSIAVFGPPGAGKSFGVKMVAKALGELGGPRAIETITFNLSQYQTAEQLADAFHLVRDLVLRGKLPLVFFDEFDSAPNGERLGWLKYFLAPMQDGEFLDNGTPHPIGQAIFVFAGGTCSTYAEFAKPFLTDDKTKPALQEFKDRKGPDFLSRLRGTLDIPGLDLYPEFDAYGPIEAFPCEAAILLRRAGILAHQLVEKAPHLKNTAGAFEVSAPVIRALLHLPNFVHGNRSFEALLDMSSLTGAVRFLPSHLPSPATAALHADAAQLAQLLGTNYPFPEDDRETIAKAIHAEYVKGPYATAELKVDWQYLPEQYRNSNLEQADDIAVKLRSVGLWFRKLPPGGASANAAIPTDRIEALGKAEHDRWAAEKRGAGWIAADSQEKAARNNKLLLHNTLFPWEKLPQSEKDKDLQTVQNIPKFLEAAGYVITSR